MTTWQSLLVAWLDDSGYGMGMGIGEPILVIAKDLSTIYTTSIQRNQFASIKGQSEKWKWKHQQQQQVA
jgi:hypothetical protein